MPTAMTVPGVTQDIGQSLPPDTPHAVSVSLPTWESCVGYEEGEQWVLGKMNNGYPRFFIDPVITRFAQAVVHKHGLPTQQALLLPSNATAARCVEFFAQNAPSLREGRDLKTVSFFPRQGSPEHVGKEGERNAIAIVVAVLFPRDHFQVAKTFWQHTGDGISSRRAEVCHKAFDDGQLVSYSASLVGLSKGNQQLGKGPHRYRKQSTAEVPTLTNTPGPNAKNSEAKDYVQYVEERFGRNLDTKLAASAKLAIKRRIAGALTADIDLNEAMEREENRPVGRGVQGLSVNDVCLYPSGMSAIFNTHRIMLKCRGPMKSICFGFPYIDTLKILEKWGPGCLFYGHGSSDDIDDIEKRCQDGETFLTLFCEFPGNPLLKSPDIGRLRSLADRYGFTIVIDETIGNFLNVHVLPYADVVVSSLTKVFSGDSNVMGGSAVLNPEGRLYGELKHASETEYEDNYWLEDAVFMERNSRDFASRIQRINRNAESICRILKASPIVKQVYYPKYSSTRRFYDQCRTPNGGYGGLLSVTFRSTPDAVTFFDALKTAKGPSLGTNFTLSCPFVLLAHYGELEWAAQFGVEADLIRTSVGLEDEAKLSAIFQQALDVTSAMQSRR